MPACLNQAWNNFVMLSNPLSHEQGSNMRHAAIANMFMGCASNGGLNSFLTLSYELDAREVQHALATVGAHRAARQLQTVLDGLNTALRVSSEEERWRSLDEHWREELDQFDVLSDEANDELMAALTRHVAENEVLYSQLE
jgi:hypothetical protein